MEKENLENRKIFEDIANEYFEIIAQENEQSEKLVKKLTEMMYDDTSLIKFYNRLVEKYIKKQRREKTLSQLQEIFSK